MFKHTFTTFIFGNEHLSAVKHILCCVVICIESVHFCVKCTLFVLGGRFVYA